MVDFAAQVVGGLSTGVALLERLAPNLLSEGIAEGLDEKSFRWAHRGAAGLILKHGRDAVVPANGGRNPRHGVAFRWLLRMWPSRCPAAMA